MNTSTLVKIGLWVAVGYGMMQFLLAPNKQVAQYHQEVFSLENTQKQYSANEASRVQALNAQLDELNLQDKQLRDCLSRALAYQQPRIQQGRLTRVTDLTELNCSGYQIEQLAGLEHFTHLKKLNLSQNRISYLEPLSNLQSLEFLDLSNNPLDSLWMITSLPALTQLRAAGMTLRDPDHVLDLPRLKSLDIRFGDQQRCADMEAFFSRARARNIRVPRPGRCINGDGASVRF